MKILIIDFETHDPHIDTLGAGWVYGNLHVVGASLQFIDWKYPVFYDKKQDIIEHVNKADVLIAHNLQYDVGILLMWNVDIFKKYLIDTMLLAKLYCTNEYSYSLDKLSSKYLHKAKAKNSLGLIVLKHKLYKDIKGNPRNIKNMLMANRYGIRHMHELYLYEPNKVKMYANQDVRLTHGLFNFYMNRKPDKKWLDRLSHLQKIVLKQRSKGIKIDLDRIRKVRLQLYSKEVELLHKLRDTAQDTEFNPLSSIQVAELLFKFNIPYPLTAKGNPSIREKWLSIQPYPICHEIREYRRYIKVRRDYCDAILRAQRLMPENKKGRVYTEFKVFGASTGRFSAAHPNIQQVPKRDKEIGPLIRSMYVPDAGETWYSLDFSQQEYRLFAHFSDILLDHSLVAEAFRADPRIDYHKFVAKLCNLERGDAKAINFGSLYGMGKEKLATSLNVSIEKADSLMKIYHNKFVDVRKLSKVCSEALSEDGYITTMGGRRLNLDPPRYVDKLVGYEQRRVLHKDGKMYMQRVPVYEKQLVSFGYKALNKLIQGSAAYQTMIVMLAVDNLGIDMLFSVHDEFNLSSTTRVDAEKVKKLMEDTLKLNVPVIVDIGEGRNWAEAKEEEEEEEE